MCAPVPADAGAVSHFTPERALDKGQEWDTRRRGWATTGTGVRG